MADLSEAQKQSIRADVTKNAVAELRAYAAAYKNYDDVQQAWDAWNGDKFDDKKIKAYVSDHEDEPIEKAFHQKSEAQSKLYDKISSIFSAHDADANHNFFLEVLNQSTSKENVHAVLLDELKERDREAAAIRKNLHQGATAIGATQAGDHYVSVNPKTVVLAGYDYNRFYENMSETYKENDVQIITAKPGVTLAEAMKDIVPPANVVLAAHGSPNSTFQWEPGGSYPYKDMLAALPRRGIASVTLLGCYTGSAEQKDILQYAPEGALVTAAIGKDAAQYNNFADPSVFQSQYQKNPMDFYINALLAIDPDLFASEVDSSNKDTDKENKKNHKPPEPHEDTLALHALPAIVGIGGNPPRTINMAHEVLRLAESGVNNDAWERTIKRVKAEDVLVLPTEVDPVAKKLRAGETLFGGRENAIGYALAAYMDESGDLAKEIGKAEHLSPTADSHPLSGLVPGVVAQHFAQIAKSHPNPAIEVPKTLFAASKSPEIKV